MGFAYVLLTVAFTIYSQLVIKWQVDRAGALPEATLDKLHFLAGLLMSPWVLSALIATFLAAVSWMAALTKLPLTVAYPFNALTFVAVMILGAAIFQEALNPAKLAGMALIALGLVVGSQKW